MKKLILLFAVSFSVLVTSCNEEDDTLSQDLLVGSWQLFQEFKNGKLKASEPCDLRKTVIFNANGIFESRFYGADSDGNCQVDDSEQGIWENLGSDNYRITFSDGQSDTEKINLSGNTFFIEYLDTFSGETIEFKDVYMKFLPE